MASRKKSSDRRRTVPPLASRGEHSDHLHRSPCRWDVLVHDLGVALAKAWWSIRGSLAEPALRPSNDDLRTAGWMLGRGAEIVIQQGLRDNAAWAAAFDAGRIDETLADEIARAAGEQCFDPLLRHDAWIAYEVILARPDRDLDRLVPALTAAVRDFLLNRCRPGGDRHDCITDPLANAARAIPENHKPRPVAQTPPRPSVDIPSLALLFADDDDAAEVKAKLLHFVRSDPWLFGELIAAINDKMNELDREGDGDDDARSIVIGATDDFLVRATGVDGRTPAELLLGRGRGLDPAQERRIRRMFDGAFSGVFLVRSVGLAHVDAIDLRTDRAYRLVATRPQALARARPGDVFHSRVTPWDDSWFLSGMQRSYGRLDEAGLAELRTKLRHLPPSGMPDRQSESFRKSMEVQATQHKAWVELFAADELLFTDGREMQAALERFYRHWGHEIAVPEFDGRTRAQEYEREHGRPAPSLDFALPEDLLDSRTVAVVFDREWGTSFLNGYGEFLSAFTSSGPLDARRLSAVRDYLTDPTIEPHIFQRMRDRFPQRTEEVFRAVLRDQHFQLDRDFEPALRRFKGELMRVGPRPSISFI